MRTLKRMLVAILFACLPTVAQSEVLTFESPYPSAVILDLSSKDMGYPYAPPGVWALQFMTPRNAYQLSSFRIYLGNYSNEGRGSDSLKVLLSDARGKNLFTSTQILSEHSSISFVEFTPEITVDADSTYFINLLGDGEVVAWLVTSAENAFVLANNGKFGTYGFRSQFALNGSSLPAASSAPNPPSPPSPVPDPAIWSLLLIGCAVVGIFERANQQRNRSQPAIC